MIQELSMPSVDILSENNKCPPIMTLQGGLSLYRSRAAECKVVGILLHPRWASFYKGHICTSRVVGVSFKVGLQNIGVISAH